MRRDTGRESASRRDRRCSMGQIFQNFVKSEKDIQRSEIQIEEKKPPPSLSD